MSNCCFFPLPLFAGSHGLRCWGARARSAVPSAGATRSSTVPLVFTARFRSHSNFAYLQPPAQTPMPSFTGYVYFDIRGCLYFDLQESTKRLTVKKLPIVICFHLKVRGCGPVAEPAPVADGVVVLSLPPAVRALNAVKKDLQLHSVLHGDRHEPLHG